jgi:hypothetical protein
MLLLRARHDGHDPDVKLVDPGFMIYEPDDAEHVVKDIISAGKVQKPASSSNGSGKKKDDTAKLAKDFVKKISKMKNFGKNVYS